MTSVVNGQVDKVVKIIASSSRSWEDAARSAIAEAAKTVQDLQSAKLVKSDIVVRDHALQYRVKLEMAFQFDRTRLDPRGQAVKVKRYLVVANRTLDSAALHELIAKRATESPAEFHVLVPQPVVTSFHADPAGLHDVAMNDGVIQSRAAAREIGEERLAAFRAATAHLNLDLTGEVALGDPVQAARQVLERSSFDEIIVSTLPAGASRWLKLDLPTRLQRAFRLPITSLIQQKDA